MAKRCHQPPTLGHHIPKPSYIHMHILEVMWIVYLFVHHQQLLNPTDKGCMQVVWECTEMQKECKNLMTNTHTPRVIVWFHHAQKSSSTHTTLCNTYQCNRMDYQPHYCFSNLVFTKNQVTKTITVRIDQPIVMMCVTQSW